MTNVLLCLNGPCPKVIYVFNKPFFTLSEPDSQALKSLKYVTEDV